METRSNHILVGVVTLAMLALVAAFLVWIVRFGDGATKEYDIFFAQSVGGLASGTGVTFAGVPSGQVTKVELWKKDPNFVRVRIAVSEDTPILEGTTATIQSVSFTAPPNIQLDGAKKGAPPITDLGPEGVPVIPTKPGALGELLNSAPLVVERLATLTDRLTLLLSDDNQKSISGILANTDKLTGTLARQAPALEALMEESRIAIRNAGQTAEKLGLVADNTNAFLTDNGEPVAKNLATTLDSASKSLLALEGVLKNAQPGAERFSNKTLPEIDQLVEDMQALTKSMTNVTERLDQGGAGSLLSAPTLPDYEPGK
ncbi:MCE family protein [Parasphingorhabdus flavimaris]|uniref:MCE family protein n=1 Tax=Parasphingorhabdus flavimaris TaxID=266812 RepID=A0ABX2N4D3_9SPHN|nr:MlaD family protein [Parasphingorhabdus flavimaris]NVD28524.1 MCE family protein [Parasphingorhabdus flavimaris]|tara:strand:+ start:11050 stop:11997 length:948 start_codon:yes stop_codon:yes gene_type:complete